MLQITNCGGWCAAFGWFEIVYL